MNTFYGSIMKKLVQTNQMGNFGGELEKANLRKKGAEIHEYCNCRWTRSYGKSV